MVFLELRNKIRELLYAIGTIENDVIVEVLSSITVFIPCCTCEVTYKPLINLMECVSITNENEEKSLRTIFCYMVVTLTVACENPLLACSEVVL